MKDSIFVWNHSGDASLDLTTSGGFIDISFNLCLVHPGTLFEFPLHQLLPLSGNIANTRKSKSSGGKPSTNCHYFHRRSLQTKYLTSFSSLWSSTTCLSTRIYCISARRHYTSASCHCTSAVSAPTPEGKLHECTTRGLTFTTKKKYKERYTNRI